MHWGKKNLAHLSKNDLYFIGNGYGEELLDEDETMHLYTILNPKFILSEFFPYLTLIFLPNFLNPISFSNPS